MSTELAISMQDRRKELSQVVLEVSLKILEILQTFSFIRCLVTKCLKRAAEAEKQMQTKKY